MALVSTQPYRTDLPLERMNITKPIKEGVTVQTTQQQPSEGGLFGFLDVIGDKAGDFFGRAVDTISNNFVSGLDDQNNNAAAVPDKTPVPTTSGGGNKSGGFIEENKTMLMYGGIALAGLVTLYLVTKKG